MHISISILILLPIALACTSTITDSCCSAAYEEEMGCDNLIYAKYGYDTTKTVKNALKKCTKAFTDSCVVVTDPDGGDTVVNSGVVKADLSEFGIVNVWQGTVDASRMGMKRSIIKIWLSGKRCIDRLLRDYERWVVNLYHSKQNHPKYQLIFLPSNHTRTIQFIALILRYTLILIPLPPIN